MLLKIPVSSCFDPRYDSTNSRENLSMDWHQMKSTMRAMIWVRP